MTGRICEDVEYVRLADGDPSSESEDVTFCMYEGWDVGDGVTGGCGCDTDRLRDSGMGIGGVGED